MARKPSREELEKRLNEASLERDMLSRVVNRIARFAETGCYMGPDRLGDNHVERAVTPGADVYVLRLFDATGPLGGIVAVTFISGLVENQNALTSVYPLDSYYDGLLRAGMSDGCTDESNLLLTAAGKLKRRRDELLDDRRFAETVEAMDALAGKGRS